MPGRNVSGDDSPLDPPEQTYLHFAQSELLLDYNKIKQQTLRDPLLGRVLLYIKSGWPDQNEIRELQPYFNRKKELYEELGCIMWGHRVVIPENCRDRVLMDLHEPHMGVSKTKAMARSYVWWAGIDEAVEAVCKQCEVCAAEADAPTRHTVNPWPWPSRPWSRIHLDFLGPFQDKIYLILIDARTKWIEVYPVPSTAARYTLNKLEEVFVRWGLPKQMVTDNGPPFTSTDFSKFTNKLGIEHLFSAPYHPASNGAAENAVRTIKKVIRKAIRKKEDIQSFLNTFLLHYRNTEHSTTGESPASLMLGRSLRTKLDLLRPDRDKKVKEAQTRQRKLGTENSRSLEPGENVWMRQYQGANKWVAGKVIERLGATDYSILDDVGRGSHRHIDQLRRRSTRNSIVAPYTPSQHDSPGVRTPALMSDSPKMPRMGEPVVREESCGERPPPELNEPKTDMVPSSPTLAAESPLPVSPPRIRPIRKCRLVKPLHDSVK
ncbi:unnamed protein product [Danaus chrysippus]|uniref:RNA-directed DNA polymerase n=1 Tax=Danaus chrysippus TaxID=151541 RepID=A0A8J2QE19_9NEOP|nr:unnamed protein product [Danaus chrysippus]